jgi:hypothetical protein
LYWDRFLLSSVLTKVPPIPSKGAPQAVHLGSVGSRPKMRRLRPIHDTSVLARDLAIMAFIFSSLGDKGFGIGIFFRVDSCQKSTIS